MPALLVAGVGLDVLFAFLVLWILAKQHPQWLDAPLHWIFKDRRSWWARILLRPLQVVASGIKAGVRWVVGIISQAAHGFATMAGKFFHGVAWLTDLYTLGLQRLASETLLALRYLRNQAIPKLVEVAVGPVRADARLAKAIAQATADTVTAGSIELANGLRALPWGAPLGWPARVAALMNAFEHLWDQVFKHIVPRLDLIQYTTLPRVAGDVQDIFDDLYRSGRESLPRIRSRLDTLEKGLGRILADPLAWLEAILLSVAGVAMLTRVLSRIAPDLFCNSTRALTRQVCGLPLDYLGELLTLLFAVEAIENLPTLVRIMQSVAHETTEGLVDLAGV